MTGAQYISGGYYPSNVFLISGNVLFLEYVRTESQRGTGRPTEDRIPLALLENLFHLCLIAWGGDFEFELLIFSELKLNTQ